MPPNESQSPDGPNFEVSIDDLLKLISPELTIEGFLKLISEAAHYAYRIYGHSPNPEDVKDLAQAIAILLIKDDCRVLRSFEHRSSLDAWLRAIARHAVLRFFPGQKSTESLEDQSPDDFVCQPEMEVEVLIEEIKESLTPRGRKLFEFKLEG
ncbi:MAG: RNA polymerase sigma factor, partial [Blastocatellia bacterium]